MILSNLFNVNYSTFDRIQEIVRKLLGFSSLKKLSIFFRPSSSTAPPTDQTIENANHMLISFVESGFGSEGTPFAGVQKVSIKLQRDRIRLISMQGTGSLHSFFRNKKIPSTNFSKSWYKLSL